MKRLSWGAALALLGASLALAAPPAPPEKPAPPDKPPADTAKPADKPDKAAQADLAKAGADADFVKEASAAGLGEINLGRLAAQNAASPDVRAFGQRMVEDHGRANDELNRVADKAGIRPSPAMSAEDEKLFNKLDVLRGEDFDRLYVPSQVDDHKAAVALFEAESKNGKNADLKALAGKLLPTLKEHLDMAQKLAAAEKKAAPEKVNAPPAEKPPEKKPPEKPAPEKKPAPPEK